ncbi:MAG: hypothetical protein WC302_01325 [Candidatus Paceibacterota bacterium]|jgi:hypothetical protein
MNKFPLLVNLLPKTDPRYKRWRRSLRKRPEPWNKGCIKESNLSVAKISRTFKTRKIDNFKKWREKAIRLGIIRNKFPKLEKNGDLAELIGVVLGDGYIGKFPRTELLTIVSNSKNTGFIERYSKLVAKIFQKKPSLSKRKTSNCVDIKIYQKEISERLDIPSGARGNLVKEIPRWIIRNRNHLKRYLRGLYEAEGSFCIHRPTYTYKFLFANKNESLKQNVYKGLEILGFHPHESKYQIQISRKEEVFKAKKLIRFRQY